MPDKRISEAGKFTTQGDGQFGEESKSLDSFPVAKPVGGPPLNNAPAALLGTPSVDPVDFDD